MATLDEKIQAALSNVEKTQAEIEPLQKLLTRQREYLYALQAMKREENKDDLAAMLFDIDAWEEIQQLVPKEQFYPSGYWPADDEYGRSENSIRLKLNYKEPILPETIEFIEKWVVISDRKTLGVFRHDLSSRYDINVMYSEIEGTWAVYDARDYSWKREGGVMFKGDLKSALEYVALHHWYDEGPDEDDFMDSRDD